MPFDFRHMVITQGKEDISFDIRRKSCPTISRIMNIFNLVFIGVEKCVENNSRLE